MRPKFNTAITLLLFSLISISVTAQNKDVHLIYIGDSITQGVQLDDPANNAPPAMATTYLRNLYTAGHIDFSNQGHSGYTTLDFLPGTDAFKQVETAATGLAAKPGMLVFSIMLGTNDSAITGPHGSPVSPDNYYANLKTMIDALLKDYSGCKIIINHPTWYSPNTYNGAQYLQEGLDRLQSYFPEIQKLADSYAASNKGRVLIGDTRAFSSFRETYLATLIPENGHRGTFYLHPNQGGAKLLGGLWAKAIYKDLTAK
ncbi:MAG: lipolytic protein G-D-S-L family [Bacteroidetes bacterium]|nr:lipolytic protein G-D-S-L family [Bacteroidota bacterium]